MAMIFNRKTMVAMEGLGPGGTASEGEVPRRGILHAVHPSVNFAGVCALGEQSPSSTGVSALGEQSPSSTGVSALGEQSPSSTGVCALGEQSPSPAGVCALGEQSPSSTGVCALGEQSPSPTGVVLTNSLTAVGATLPVRIIAPGAGKSDSFRLAAFSAPAATVDALLPKLAGTSTTGKAAAVFFSASAAYDLAGVSVKTVTASVSLAVFILVVR